MDTLCRQYTLRFIITPNIGRNKIKKTQITYKYRKQKNVAYSVPLVPFPVLCL
ncbi:hypothetical protein V8F33_014174, partial [Rhypophila sp. PSN 637]